MNVTLIRACAALAFAAALTVTGCSEHRRTGPPTLRPGEFAGIPGACNLVSPETIQRVVPSGKNLVREARDTARVTLPQGAMNIGPKTTCDWLSTRHTAPAHDVGGIGELTLKAQLYAPMSPGEPEP